MVSWLSYVAILDYCYYTVGRLVLAFYEMFGLQIKRKYEKENGDILSELSLK
jgi:hypothetical protein